MKHYKVKLTPELRTKLKKWWKQYLIIFDDYWEQVGKLEKQMAEDTGIKDAEFFFHEEVRAVGIGNAERTLRLIQRDELEK